MNDEEIMKKFNETFSDNNQVKENKQQETVTPYKATMNQNVVPNNPTVNNNPVVSNGNIPPLENNNTTSVVNNSSLNDNNNVNRTTPSNVNYNYVPKTEVEKKKTVSFKINKDLIPVFVIIIVLLLSLFLFPAIYDLFTKV